MLITLDWETAFGKSPEGRKVTVRSMTTEEYVRDHEFKAHGVGIKINDKPARYYYGHQIEQILSVIPWDQAYLLCHHAQFDGAILAWRYGIVPKFYLDTVSMAQALHNHVPASLAYLGEYLDVGTKGKELMTVKDKWVLNEEEQAVLGGYCALNEDSDVNLTYRIFQKLKVGYPAAELETIDDTIRMFTQPSLIINAEPLRPAYEQELKRKADLVAATGRTKGEFTSNEKFANLLRERGVQPPMKLSETTGKPTYAFAKSDEEFLALEFHQDPIVQAYVKARLGVKTSIVETRIKRFMEIATRGTLPCYLKSNSAHTKRWGGGDKSNLQNLGNRGTGLVLRESMEAPDGHLLVVNDLNQIEARVLVAWAGQTDRVEMFRAGGDPYNDMASDLYGEEIDRKLKLFNANDGRQFDITKSKPDEVERLKLQTGGGVEVEPFKKQGNVGKATVLGCFGPDTLVVTKRGAVKIVDITADDMVWDGCEFVKHQGVVYQGVKQCQSHAGVKATPDHEILTERGWQAWSEVRTNPSLFLSAISRGNLPSLSGGGIIETPEQSTGCSVSSPTYDIAYAGPRNRYTVVTDAGPIIVHNCGYGLGWANFQGQLRVGFLGMEGIIYGEEYVDQLNVSIENFKVSRSYDPQFATLEEQALSLLPLGVSPEDHIRHCAVVWTIVNRYREMNPKVKRLWKTMNQAMEYMIAGQEVQIGPVKTVKDGILLPSGLVIKYTGLRKSKSGEYSYLKQIRPSGAQEWTKLYGGKIVENVVQALSRILISDSITDTRKAGYNVALTVHDEQVCVVPAHQAQECGEFVRNRLCTPPWWMPNLPLGASVDIVRNYAEAK